MSGGGGGIASFPREANYSRLGEAARKLLGRSAEPVPTKSAMLVLGFAAGKALLYDAASAPTTIRILCLLLTGAALYGSGFLIRKISGWKNEKAAGA